MSIQENNIRIKQEIFEPISNSKILSTEASTENNEAASNKRLIKRMQNLLSFEATLRRLKTEKELMFFSVNEIRKLLGCRQALIARCQDKGFNYKIKAISSMSDVDRNSPIVRWFEKTLKSNGVERGMVPYSLDMTPELEKTGHEYPFPYLYHVPLKDRQGKTFAAIILTRDKPWREAEVPIIKRIEEAVSYAWAAQLGKKGKMVSKPWKRFVGIGVGMALLAAGFFPVPMSVLAPVEVVASSPTVITAPFDGVLDEIYVRSGDDVDTGELLFKMVDTDLLNRNKIAIQDMKIAKTRLLRSSRAASQNNEALQDLAISQTEYNLKIAEQAYAKSLLERSQAFAPNQGVVLFQSKNDLIGKPVSTGERIMRIADPSKTEFKIEVPLADSIIIQNDARVRVFLDADPLHPLNGKVEYASLEAKEVPGGQLAYEVIAQPIAEDGKTQINPRVGLRGTAQILGDKVPLAFYLFRRPLSAMRQWFGV